MEIDIKTFHKLEIEILNFIKDGEEFDKDLIIEKTSLNEGQCNQSFSWLVDKGIINEIRSNIKTCYELTNFGESFSDKNTYEELILTLLETNGPLTFDKIIELTNLDKKDIGTVYGKLEKDGLLILNNNKQITINNPNKTDRIKIQRNLISKAITEKTLYDDCLSMQEKEIISTISKKRGSKYDIFRMFEKEKKYYILTENGFSIQKKIKELNINNFEITNITESILRTGEWKGKQFKSFNINSPVQHLILGRKNVYCDFLENVKNKLVALGFEEFDGPIVETEFWNSDALYMPQFHSSRDIHDVYYLDNPKYAKKIDNKYLDEVSKTHENGGKTNSKGWGYKFDKDFTRRLILRSHGTVLSAKNLSTANIPGKYFGIVRCFRYDKVDATHLSDFYQTEGIVLGEDVNLKTLMGLLKVFAEQIAGATEVMYVPAYFPFTEPSLEVHIKHPKLGWFELGGAGIFRPEVTVPLGVNTPVIAWGLGVDRMALMSSGLSDLRDLFSFEIDNARRRRIK
ncbi:MAG: phenylalanine--tRNA ligase subunit alpha [Spirochaetes bacterium GWC1_27_15]|nr:MAG: phenylalanine--tRNA ligase subunit alpha [Spirochaetes bacterium GWC1_27_15]